MEVQINPNAVTAHPDTISFTLGCGLRDGEGNTVQVIPLAVEGICYPFGGHVDALIQGIVRQIQDKINERMVVDATEEGVEPAGD